ncbi:uncharacterized protein LOC126237021 [Schistocerca nitens]|uniref:uncharacterized protein LOC126237021 n=1 Tax=Schistocerca nitens TaxID=7011 RepID=UPI002118DA5B|nr:uncharacterized protein LOC126237021 [Schistocerca nitens]
MPRNLSDACWSSDDSSFGWVDMEDIEPAASKKTNTVEERISETEDDSSDDSDSTQFDSESKNRPVLKDEREQKENQKRNDPISTNISQGRVKNDVSEDSDSTQFDLEFDNRPVVKDAIRSKGNNPLNVSGDQLKLHETNNSSNHETSENSASAESGSESSDDSDKNELKPFTKSLLVKEERRSHVLSDDSEVDSSPLKTRLRVKSESGTTQQTTKGDKHVPLIEGVLLDTVQPLPLDIGDNEDVWIVQCPNEMSEATLKGKTLNFNGISCAEQFEGSVLLTANTKPMNLLLPKSPLKLKSLTPAGHIIFKEKEMASYIVHPICNEDNLTSLPTGLKERHPLFGADLSLVQKLSSQLQKRKKKKKKKKQDVSDLGSTFCEDENEMPEAENGPKFTNSLDDSPSHIKKKKKKRKHLSEETVAFNQDSDTKSHSLHPSFHSGNSPRIKSEQNINGFVIDDYIQPELQQKKHRKVKHEPGEAVSPLITNLHSELAYATPSKKRKHKHLEYSFENDRMLAGGTSDEAENILSQKRKKRKYEDASNTSYDVYSTSERTIEPSESVGESSDLVSPKKKKHHKYERDFQRKNIENVNNKSDELAIYSEEMTLDPVADGLLHTVKKKKKKIKENDTESVVSPNIKTNSDINFMSTKKKKKLKIENSDRHLEQLSFDATDTKKSLSDVTGADFDYFDANRKKLHKEERRKFEETGCSAESSGENLTLSKFFKHTPNNSLLKQETSYADHSPVIDVHQKKKKKRKSE